MEIFKEKVLPIFSSHYSIGKSILTLDETGDELDENKPISIFSIAKKYGLKEIFLVENNFSGFLEAWKNSKKMGVDLRFGYRVTCCNNLNDKTPQSFDSEHKIIIWLKDYTAYKYAIKIASKAQTDGFFYIPRIDNEWLNKLWNNSLQIGIPFYDSYLFNNLLTFSKCNPNFPDHPVFFTENNELPFDNILRETVSNASNENDTEIQKSQSIFYYKKSHFKAYSVFRCINNRSNLNKPELSFFSSDSFCFENLLKTNGLKLI